MTVIDDPNYIFGYSGCPESGCVKKGWGYYLQTPNIIKDGPAESAESCGKMCQKVGGPILKGWTYLDSSFPKEDAKNTCFCFHTIGDVTTPDFTDPGAFSGLANCPPKK